mgnify:CR=1 FL=1
MIDKEELETFREAMYDTLKGEEYYYADLNNNDKNISWNSGWKAGLAFSTGAVMAIINFNSCKNLYGLYRQIVNYLNEGEGKNPCFEHAFDVGGADIDNYEAGFKTAIDSQKELISQTWEELFATDEEDEDLDDEEQ